MSDFFARRRAAAAEPLPADPPFDDPPFDEAPVIEGWDVGLDPSWAMAQRPLALVPDVVTDMPANVIVVRDPQKDAQLAVIVAGLQPVRVEADALEVVDAVTCARGEVLFDLLRQGELAISENCDQDCDRAHKVWKGLTEQRAAPLTPTAATRKLLGERVAAWKVAQKQREDAAQREAEAKARQEVVAAAQREAEKLVKQGHMQAAAQVVQEARTAPAPLVPARPTAVPSTGRTSTRQPWVCELVDWSTLRAAIGKGDYPEFEAALIAALQPLLNAQAKVLQGELGKRYPGTEGRRKPGLAGR